MSFPKLARYGPRRYHGLGIPPHLWATQGLKNAGQYYDTETITRFGETRFAALSNYYGWNWEYWAIVFLLVRGLGFFGYAVLDHVAMGIHF